MALVQRHLTQADWDRLAPEHAGRMPGANALMLAFGRWMVRRFERREARGFG
jgi:hypothetical protein